jgi:hypothetical protein
MKNLRTIASPFIVPMLLLSAALAQVANSEIPDQLPVSVAVARCQYSPADEACLSSRESGALSSEKSPDGTLAQMPRRIPEPPRLPRRPPGPYPRLGYPRAAVPAPNVRHAAIGFLIGFTLGVVHSNDRTAGSHVALGLICGGLGAVIGAAVPSFSSHHSYPAGSWPDDDDDEMASRSQVAKPASPEPVSAEAATTSAPPTSPAGAP